jgi:hypothetical protein
MSHTHNWIFRDVANHSGFARFVHSHRAQTEGILMVAICKIRVELYRRGWQVGEVLV